MDVGRHDRRAVSPIIATLLLIAIAVAAGIIVYVFVGGLSSTLTKGNTNQLTEQLSLDAYNYASYTSSTNTLVVYLRNTGSASVTVSQFYVDGNLLTIGLTVTTSISAQTEQSYTIQVTAGTSVVSGSVVNTFTAGTSHALKIITSDGGTFTFNVIAGSSG